MDAVAGRGTFYQLVHKDENIRRIDALLAEIRSNIITIKTLQDDIKQNRASRFTLFHSCALELLLTTRYLDENELFYDSIQCSYEIIDIFNSALNFSPIEKPKNQETYLGIDWDKTLTRDFTNLREKVLNAKTKLQELH